MKNYSTINENQDIITKRYLLQGFTMDSDTSGITFPADSSAYNTKGIRFLNGSRIGENTSGDMGLYSARGFYIRPYCSSGVSSYGLKMDSDNFSPTTSGSMSLGTSSFRYSGIWVNDSTGLNGGPIHYTSYIYAGTGTASNATTTNGNTKITVTDNTTVGGSITIKGSNGINVTSDSNGIITVDGASVGDTKVTNTLNNTVQAYITGTTSSSTNTGTQVFDSGVYLTTTAGRLNASSYSVGVNGLISYNSTTGCIEITT